MSSITTPREQQYDTYRVCATTAFANTESDYPTQAPIALLTRAHVADYNIELGWTAGYGRHDSIPIEFHSRGSLGRTAIFRESLEGSTLEVVGKYIGFRQPQDGHLLTLAFFTATPELRCAYKPIAQEITRASAHRLTRFMYDAWGVNALLQVRAGFVSSRRSH